MNVTSGFSNVDAYSDQIELITFLNELNKYHATVEYKNFFLEKLAVKSNYQVLDVGCGTGYDTFAIGNQLKQNGYIIGVDKSTAMINYAQKNTMNKTTSAHFIVGDATQLMFRNCTFDCCRIDRVLQHINYPDIAIKEMLRTLKPNGIFGIAEPDWETLVVDTKYPGITRKLFHNQINFVRYGWMGRSLYGRITEHTIKKLRILPYTMVITDLAKADQLFLFRKQASRLLTTNEITVNEISAWYDDLKFRAAHQRFFASLTIFIAIGTK